MIFFALSFPRIRGYKIIGLRCCLVLIEFSQMFFQGIWNTDSALLQIKGLSPDIVDKIVRKFKKAPKLNELIKTPHDQRKILNVLPDDVNKDLINQEIDKFPNISFKHEVFVKDEKEICAGDFVTIKFTLTREHLKDGEEQSTFVTNYYPFKKRERWYVIIADEEKNLVIWFKPLNSPKKVVEESFNYRFTEPMKIKWRVYLRSDCYRELDQDSEMEFTILPEDTVKREVFVHPEDAALDKQPSLFAQLMQGFGKQDESDEELEEDEKDAKAKKELKGDGAEGEEEDGKNAAGNDDEELEEEEEEDVDTKKKKQN
eukprot:TRINITY_DN1662_c0_g1_i1.p2 TRINITY_DN1662_c0_g1~~TRINITY_DN1662_c0_g1_i1.p2  ORF type:complete len:315 (-),score=138.20 TRINITY_DN1662_c0_g1_i1:800-1744(-)